MWVAPVPGNSMRKWSNRFPPRARPPLPPRQPIANTFGNVTVDSRFICPPTAPSSAFKHAIWTRNFMIDFTSRELWRRTSARISISSADKPASRSHRESHQRIIQRQHREQSAAFHGIILAVQGTSIGVMKITGAQLELADVQIARENIKILRANIRMRGISHTGFEFAEQHRITALAFQ